MRRLSCIVILLLFFAALPLLSQEVEKGYFALYLNGSRSGYSIQERRVENDRVINSSIRYLELSRMGTPLQITEKTTMIETLTGKPLGFLVEQESSDIKTSIEGRVGPDGVMEITTDTAGDIQTVTLPYPEGSVMSEGLDIINRKQGLEHGISYSALAFIPNIIQAFEVTFHVGKTEQMDLLGRVIELTEITGNYALPGGASLSFRSYVDQDFKAQKMILPAAGMEIEMVAASREVALSGIEAAEMVSAMTVKSPRPITDIKNTKAIAYILKPDNPDTSLSVPETDNQQIEKLTNNRIRLTVRPVKVDSGAGFPYRGSNSELLKALESTPYLQSDHPEIIALSKKAVAGKKSALEAARAIEAFVAGYIQNKDLSVGYASALEVSRSRQGDCTEHAVLTAALCRAAGIPAQVVMGITYVNQFFDMKNSFGGHAWTQVFIGDKWMGLDAALKDTERNGFSAGHITMAVGNGDPGDFFGMLGLLGKFTIESIEIER